MNEETFKEMLAETYGIDDATEVNLDRIITRSINKISEYYPFPESASLQTVKGQTRYTVTHDDIIKVKEVHYRKTLNSNPFNDPDVPVQIANPSASNPSRLLADQMEIEMQNRLNPTGARIVSNDIFDLLPTPEVVETIYYEYDRYRTFAEIPKFFEEEMIELVMYYKNDPSYRKNRSVNNGNVFQFDRRGNSTESDMNVKDFTELREDELKKIESKIKIKVNKLG